MNDINDNNKFGVYCITNIINGKRYVGQTLISFERRWTSHRSELRKGVHANRHMQNAWNRHGENNFKFSILEICTEENINDAEVFWIYTFKTLNIKYGYNKRFGGSNGKLTEEAKRKIGKANSGENSGWYGKKHTIEWKQKMSGENNFMFGKSHSDDTKAKMSQSAVGRVFSNETREKLSIAGRKRTNTSTTRKKISMSNVGKGKNPVSGYTGVSAGNKDKTKWNVCVSINGKRKHVGVFTDVVEAALAYDREFYKAYRTTELLNFPNNKQYRYDSNFKSKVTRNTMHKNNTSGYPGVRWVENRNKWRVSISINGKKKHLGMFADFEDAVNTRNNALLLLHNDTSIS